MDKAATVAKPLVSQMAELLSAVSSFAWPVVFGTILFYFRKEITDVIQSLRRQLNAGATFKLKDFEVKGIVLDAINEDARGNWVYLKENASEEEYRTRDAVYQKNRNLFLVHTASRTDEYHPKQGFRLVDVSIFLIPHQGYAKDSTIQQFGRLNEVNEVEYYFGRHWGSGDYGRSYRVRNGSDGFAVRFRPFGPTLCVATVRFHDGEEVKLERYIDFQSAGGMKSGDVAEAMTPQPQ
jgi:hypothetical protein